MRAWPAGRQGIEQFFLDLIPGVARGPGTHQLDGAGVRRPPNRQPVHLTQLTV